MAEPVRRMRTAPAAKRAAPKVTEETGRGRVSVQAKDRDGPYHETDREDTILTRKFREGEHPAYVKVGAGMTINLGDFNSLRIDVSVSLPCLPEEIDECQILASDWVADKVADEETNWLGQSTKAPAKRGK